VSSNLENCWHLKDHYCTHTLTTAANQRGIASFPFKWAPSIRSNLATTSGENLFWRFLAAFDLGWTLGDEKEGHWQKLVKVLKENELIVTECFVNLQELIDP